MNADSVRIFDGSRLGRWAFDGAETPFFRQNGMVWWANTLWASGLRAIGTSVNAAFPEREVAMLRSRLRGVNRLKHSVWRTGGSRLVNGVGWHWRLDRQCWMWRAVLCTGNKLAVAPIRCPRFHRPSTMRWCVEGRTLQVPFSPCLWWFGGRSRSLQQNTAGVSTPAVDLEPTVCSGCTRALPFAAA